MRDRCITRSLQKGASAKAESHGRGAISMFTKKKLDLGGSGVRGKRNSGKEKSYCSKKPTTYIRIMCTRYTVYIFRGWKLADKRKSNRTQSNQHKKRPNKKQCVNRCIAGKKRVLNPSTFPGWISGFNGNGKTLCVLENKVLLRRYIYKYIPGISYVLVRYIAAENWLKTWNHT